MLTLTYSKDLFFAGAKASLFLTAYAVIALMKLLQYKRATQPEMHRDIWPGKQKSRFIVLTPGLKEANVSGNYLPGVRPFCLR